MFRIGNIPHRLGAAIIGWNAAWRMGIVIGIVLIPIGLRIRGNADYFWGMIRVFGIVAVTTLVVGLGTLAIAFLIVDADTIGEITWAGNDIADDAAFARAETLHNFSYFGGLVGIITGYVAIFWQSRRLNNSASTLNANVYATGHTDEPDPKRPRAFASLIYVNSRPGNPERLASSRVTDARSLHPSRRSLFVSGLPPLPVDLFAIPLILVGSACYRVSIGDALNVEEILLFPLSVYVVVVLCLASSTILRRWCKHSLLLIALALLLALAIILSLPIYNAHPGYPGWNGVHGHFMWDTAIHLH